MNSITQSNRYLPHELSTKIHAVTLYRQAKSVKFVCRRYHISKPSLMRWNKRYDGSKESLFPRSHKPKRQHPNAHTEEEIGWIRNYHRRTPTITLCELYGKLKREKGYQRHPNSLYRVFIRLGYRSRVESTKKASYKPKPYDTPTQIGIKWQMDVKYVPTACYAGKTREKFYQYTMLDEASRERFLYAYEEQSSYSTVDFVQKAIRHFGYAPEIIQTDNGAEFTHLVKTERIHPLDVLCKELNITHKLIRPRTPRHNGKVERSHRNDQERFYNYLKFYSFADLQKQLQDYLRRSNRIPMRTLNWKTPIEMRLELMKVPEPGAPTGSLRSGLRPSLRLPVHPHHPSITAHMFLVSHH